jgi:hypothetical protein
MSITWIDGFDLYTGTNDGTTRYILYQDFESYVTGRLGVGQAAQWGGGGAFVEFANNFGSTSNNVSIGFGWKPNSLGNGIVIEFRSGGGQICQLESNSAGQLIAKRNGTTLGSSAAVLAPTVWGYIEVEFTRHASAGVFKVYYNGLQILNLTAQNTGSADIDSIRAGYNVTQFAIDDLYCTNTATRLGECRVDVLHPTADTAQKDWTASTGSNNYACIDEAQYDTSDYISAGTVGNKDLYTLGDLSFNPLTIYAVQATCFAKKDDASTRTFRQNIKSSSSTGNGATKALGTSYQILTDIFETDPNGSIAWTQSSVNALTAGPEVVS